MIEINSVFGRQVVVVVLLIGVAVAWDLARPVAILLKSAD
jgi:hypothetical protein